MRETTASTGISSIRDLYVRPCEPSKGCGLNGEVMNHCLPDLAYSMKIRHVMTDFQGMSEVCFSVPPQRVPDAAAPRLR